jgi:hypothetical protein
MGSPEISGAAGKMYLEAQNRKLYLRDRARRKRFIDFLTIAARRSGSRMSNRKSRLESCPPTTLPRAKSQTEVGD